MHAMSKEAKPTRCFSGTRRYRRITESPMNHHGSNRRGSVLCKPRVPRRLCMLRRLLLPLDPQLADAAAQREVVDVGELARGVARGDELRGA
jgi:hypothetical protein